MDWLDLLAVQGTLKSLLQHHSLKASILWRSAFFIVQLSHPYSTTGKGVFSCSLSTLSRGMFTLVLGPGIELGPSAWGARSLSQWMTREVLYHCISIFFFPNIYVFSLSLVAKSSSTLVTLWTVARQASLSMGFSRQECWSGLSFPSPGHLPDSVIEAWSPALQEICTRFFTN